MPSESNEDYAVPGNLHDIGPFTPYALKASSLPVILTEEGEGAIPSPYSPHNQLYELLVLF